MKKDIKNETPHVVEPPLVANNGEVNHAWALWAQLQYNISYGEALHRGERRLAKPKPKRKFWR